MASNDGPTSAMMSWRFLRQAARVALRPVELSVFGQENVPSAGPTLIVARHFHHLYDGCALLTTVPRQLHLVVTNDWAAPGIKRRLLERACEIAQWPVVMRPDASERAPDPQSRQALQAESQRTLRQGLGNAVSLLQAGHAVAIFPEGYPNVDPSYTPKTSDTDVLPFRSGFARIVRLAQADRRTRVAVIPAGLEYARLPQGRWRLDLRFGEPRYLDDPAGLDDFQRHVEADVLRLSGIPQDTGQAAARGTAEDEIAL